MLVLFVSFSASNSVLRLMRCYCFYPCYLSLCLSSSLSLARWQCVCGIFHVNQNPTKVKQSIRICCNCSTASTVSLVFSHFFHLCSILSSPLPALLSPLPPRGHHLPIYTSRFGGKLRHSKICFTCCPTFRLFYFTFLILILFFSSSSSTSSLPFSFVHSLV